MRFTDEAQIDLAEILAYTQEEWGSRRRIRYRQLLMESLRTLTSNPFIGREREDLAPGLRSHPLDSYTVFYSVTDDEVRLWRVLHGSRSTARIAWKDSGQTDS